MRKQVSCANCGALKKIHKGHIFEEGKDKNGYFFSYLTECDYCGKSISIQDEFKFELKKMTYWIKDEEVKTAIYTFPLKKDTYLLFDLMMDLLDNDIFVDADEIRYTSTEIVVKIPNDSAVLSDLNKMHDTWIKIYEKED